MKYIFFVQNEGRGHLTQALSLKAQLEARRHEVAAFVIGDNKAKPTPAFFTDQIAPNRLYTIASPRFATDRHNQGILVFYSTLLTIWRTPLYIQSFFKIRKLIRLYQPDVLVNFYESMAGNYYRFSFDKRPMVCISHQYFIDHPSFQFPPISRRAKFSFRFYNLLTAPHRATKIALSFTEEADNPHRKMFICPPLIRPEIKSQTPTINNFILVYILNHGYSTKIIDWCRNHPEQKVEAFWDKPGAAETHFNSNLVFHYLDGQKFINRLVNCAAYASTGGFDSIAEAAYLQKIIMMTPAKGHFEQKCNAADAKRAGLATTSVDFNLSFLAEQSPKNSGGSEQLIKFKNWVDKNETKIVDLLEQL